MRKNSLVIQISVVSISLLFLFVSFASDALGAMQTYIVLYKKQVAHLFTVTVRSALRSPSRIAQRSAAICSKTRVSRASRPQIPLG
jgi:hypothetical protein